MKATYSELVVGFSAALGYLVACGSAPAAPDGVNDLGAVNAEEDPASPNAGERAGDEADPASPTSERPEGVSADDEAPVTSGERIDEVVNPGGFEGSDLPTDTSSPTDDSPSDPSPPVDSAPDDDSPPVVTNDGAEEGTDCVIPTPSSVPIGYGAATTGGGAAAAVTVRNFAEAEAALSDYRAAFKDGTQNALVLRYAGTFDYATLTDVCAQHEKEAQRLQIKEMANVTFEGAPGSSANFGIHINRATNVVVRNMTLGLLPGGGDSDAITIEGNDTNGDVENVWIDHNELFSSTKDDCPGAGDTEFDGLIDIKKGARRITLSFNYLHDHQKTGLLGFSDSDDTERYVTFHHNWYENVVSRTPLHRFGYVHLFNNYYSNVSSSGINVRMGGVALIEANFFENVHNPVTSRYSDEAGFWDLRDNHVGPGITWSTDGDTLANAEDWQSTTVFPADELDYTYTPDAANCVKQIVVATAGATL